MLPQPSKSPSKIIFAKSRTFPVKWDDFSLGVNKLKAEKNLLPQEMSSCINMKYNDWGNLETREGLEQVTTAAAENSSAIKAISYAFVLNAATYGSATFGGGYLYGGAAYWVVVADDNDIVYYLDGSNTLNKIHATRSCEGDVNFVPYAGYIVIFDGGYVKYWDGTTFNIAYDDGTGSSGYMFDYTDDDQDATADLYSGGTTRCGMGQTLPSWTTGFTIPCTELRAVISATGSPTGNITAKIYDSTRASVLATSDAVDSSTVATSATEYTFTFSTQYDMSPATTYFCSIEYSGGDDSNYISVHKDSTTNLEYYYDGSWHLGTGYPLIGLKPGRPPKGMFGDVWNNRLFFCDPDNLGYVRFSNENTIFDFSTSDGGGWIGVVDDNANTFPVGGIRSHQGELYVVGKETNPYVCRITGTEPERYSQALLQQELCTDNNCMLSTINDVWFVSADGVYPLSGIALTGDMATQAVSDPIYPLIKDYFSSASFAGYYPPEGQFWLKMDGYSKVLVCHTKRPVQYKSEVRYPWVEYEFKDLTPTAFAYLNGTMYVGCSDGHLYSLTATVNDNGTQPDYEIASGFREMPQNKLMAERYYTQAASDAAATFDLSFYKDGGSTATLTVNESVEDGPIRRDMLLPYKSLKIKVDNLSITQPFKFAGVSIDSHMQEI